MSSEDSNGKCKMNSASDNREIMISFDTDKNIKELFDLLMQRYHVDLEQSLKDRKFDYVDGLHYECHNVSLNYGGSYINHQLS